MAAPVVANAGGANNTTGSTVSIPVPTGVTSGSLIVASVFGDWGAGFNGSLLAGIGGAFTAPDGTWTFAGIELGLSLGGFGQYVGYWYKYATGADSGTYAFTAKTVSGSTSTYTSGWAALITGGTASGSPFSDTAQSASVYGLSVTVNSFTPGGDSSLLLASYLNESGGTRTWPSGWSGDLTGTTPILYVGHTAQTTATATGSLVYSSDISDGSAVLIVTLRPPVSSTGGLAWIRA